jgi:hypothetical protein
MARNTWQMQEWRPFAQKSIPAYNIVTTQINLISDFFINIVVLKGQSANDAYLRRADLGSQTVLLSC